MKIQIANEEIIFFEKHGWIEFEGLLRHEDWQKLARGVDVELALRFHQQKNESQQSMGRQRVLHSAYSVGKIELQPDDIMAYGRDLALTSQDVRPVLFSRKMAETAYQLTNKKPLRWGFDQVITDYHLRSYSSASVDLAKSVSITGLVLAGAICIDEDIADETEREGEKEGALMLMPESSSRVLFWKPTVVVHPSQKDETTSSAPLFPPIAVQDALERALISSSRHKRVLFFAFADAKPIYVMNSNDHATHFLKRFGYVFGDRLKETTHPVLYR